MRRMQKLFCFLLAASMLAALCACAPKNELGIREKDNKNMVTFHFGPRVVSYSLSNGIVLKGEEGSEFICSTSTQDPKQEGVFLLNTLSVGGKATSVTVASGTTVYWANWYDDENGTHYSENETIWLEFINRKDSKIIGYAVGRLDELAEDDASGTHAATLVKAVTFPKVDGEYPTVTDEQVEQLMKSVETE